MKRFSFVLIALSAFAILTACGGENEPATAQQSAPPKTTAAAVEEFKWYTSFDEGLAAAKKDGKPILLDFYADWCKYCKLLDKETFVDPVVKSRLAKDWVGIRIDGEDKNAKATFKGKTYSHSELMQLFGVRGFPTLLFFDKKGEPVEPYTTYINYVPAKPFAPLLDYFRDELYRDKVDINEYIKSKI
jgi:thioredoxin-related protein